jgi:hypothetical protein
VTLNEWAALHRERQTQGRADLRAGLAVMVGLATGWFDQPDHCRCGHRRGVSRYAVPLRKRLRFPMQPGVDCLLVWRCETCGTTAMEPDNE